MGDYTKTADNHFKENNTKKERYSHEFMATTFPADGKASAGGHGLIIKEL